MSKLTDRAAYLLGMADGMKLDTTTNEGRMLQEILKLLEEITHHMDETDATVKELGDYVEDIDADLGEVEEEVYQCDCDCDCDCEDEDDDCHCCHCADEDDDCDPDECTCNCCCDQDGEILSIELHCPNCGKLVTLSPDAIEAEESPKCEFCGEPFFTDLPDEDEEEEPVEEVKPKAQPKKKSKK